MRWVHAYAYKLKFQKNVGPQSKGKIQDTGHGNFCKLINAEEKTDWIKEDCHSTGVGKSQERRQ